jgi:thymidylate synthase (FAD)
MVLVSHKARDMRTPLYNGQGYIQLIESWGSDERVIESARMSTARGFEGWGPRRMVRGTDAPASDFTAPELVEEKPGDEKLLGYLYSNRHMTPFEMGGMTVEFMCPIFVIRQIHRHRTFGYNELSARYTELPDECWLPRVEEVRVQSASTKQATDAAADLESAAWFVDGADRLYKECRAFYEEALRRGIAREQARAVMPVANFTKCRMTGNLRNWLAFLALRMDKHAQKEVRDLADAAGAFIHDKFPRSFELFDDWTLRAVTIPWHDRESYQAWRDEQAAAKRAAAVAMPQVVR